LGHFGLGIGGVLFSGIAVGHVAAAAGVQFDLDVLHFMREFGLILFVYTIGIQVGPSFFRSFGAEGLRLNLAALAIVGLGVAVALAIYHLFSVDVAVLVGVMSGAVTNTPGLGAATQVLADAGFPDATLGLTGLGYAVAYPFGIVGILASMLLVRALMRVDIAAEAAAWQAETGSAAAALPSIDVVVTNPNVDGMKLGDIPGLFDGELAASRILQGEEVGLPTRKTVLHAGDTLHIVGPAKALAAMKLLLGPEAAAPITTKGSRMTWARLVVTDRKALGVPLSDLALPEGRDVTITRINRAGIELPPRAHRTLAFGDIITVVGLPDDIEAVLVGSALGILLGSIPLAIPGLPAPLKLGLAGGPLVVAILLGRLGHFGPFVWFMPPVANTALREIGIVLFLAVVGITAGDRFVETLVHGPGLAWIGYGVLITLIPLITVGLIARAVFGVNYLSLSGVMAGSMTDPPALAFAVAMNPASAASVAYVSVYPLVMFLRILAPQLMVLLLAGA
ncbi:MAG TPA: transporter, partial [Rhodobacterales bacterium]|nr:transporter [Rhodobacterales bacterium]